MIDEVCRENRKGFEEKFGAKKLDFLPNKYVPKYIEQDRRNMYDHPIMFRSKEYDYLFISNYWPNFTEQLEEEGFEETVPMYNTSCITYMKRFKNTGSSRIEESE